jgi:hypothetical protein
MNFKSCFTCLILLTTFPEDESIMRFSKTAPIMADPEVCTRVGHALHSDSAVFPGLLKLSEWKGGCLFPFLFVVVVVVFRV